MAGSSLLTTDQLYTIFFKCMSQTAQLKQAAHFVLAAWQQVAWFRHKRLLHPWSTCKTTPRHWAVQRECMLTARRQRRFAFYGGILREKAAGHPGGLTAGLCLAGPRFRSRQRRDRHVQGKASVQLWTVFALVANPPLMFVSYTEVTREHSGLSCVQGAFGLHKAPSINNSPPPTHPARHCHAFECTAQVCVRVCVFMYVSWV